MIYIVRKRRAAFCRCNIIKRGRISIYYIKSKTILLQLSRTKAIDVFHHQVPNRFSHSCNVAFQHFNHKSLRFTTLTRRNKLIKNTIVIHICARSLICICSVCYLIIVSILSIFINIIPICININHIWHTIAIIIGIRAAGCIYTIICKFAHLINLPVHGVLKSHTKNLIIIQSLV